MAVSLSREETKQRTNERRRREILVNLLELFLRAAASISPRWSAEATFRQAVINLICARCVMKRRSSGLPTRSFFSRRDFSPAAPTGLRCQPSAVARIVFLSSSSLPEVSWKAIRKRTPHSHTGSRVFDRFILQGDPGIHLGAFGGTIPCVPLQKPLNRRKASNLYSGIMCSAFQKRQFFIRLPSDLSQCSKVGNSTRHYGSRLRGRQLKRSRQRSRSLSRSSLLDSRKIRRRQEIRVHSRLAQRRWNCPQECPRPNLPLSPQTNVAAVLRTEFPVAATLPYTTSEKLELVFIVTQVHDKN